MLVESFSGILRPLATVRSISKNHKESSLSTSKHQSSLSVYKSSTEFPTIVIPKNYNVAIGSLAITILSLVRGNFFVGVPFAALSLLLFVQTGKIRFVLDNEAFELFVSKGGEENKEALEETRENIVVGGKNRWKYDSFVNWFFIPSKEFPILVYFKENQTPNRKDESGQIHFFPALMDGRKLYETMYERIGPKEVK